METNPFHRILHLSVARLFGQALTKDVESLKASKTKQISLAAKWAPPAQGFHDWYTNIVSSIAEYLFEREDICPEVDPADRGLYLRHAREAYCKEVITPLRKALDAIERAITAQAFVNTKYERVPSIMIDHCPNLFIRKDINRFEKQFDNVAAGKQRVSGATLLPSTLVRQARLNAPGFLLSKWTKKSNKKLKKSLIPDLIADKTRQIKSSVADVQWKTLVKRVKDSGRIKDSIAVCDFSRSMSWPTFHDGTCPLDCSIGLPSQIFQKSKRSEGGKMAVLCVEK